MDYQTLFNVAVALAGFFGGYTLNSISRAIDRLELDVRNLPHTYVSRVDSREDISEMKSMLTRIADKLEGKADKHSHPVG